MEQKASQSLLLLLLLLLVFAASSDGVPITRGLRVFNHQELKELAHDLKDIDQEVVFTGTGNDSQLSNIDEISLVERRMDLATMDYPGTGANNDHYPGRP